MKKATVVVSLLFSMSSLFAQGTKKNTDETGFITCSQFGITKPLSEMFPVNAPEKKKRHRDKEVEDHENNIPQKFPKTVEKDGPAYGNDDAATQKEPGTIPNKAPIQNFTGQSGANIYPLDPTGAVGPNHYVQMINSTTFRIYSKTGTTLLSGTLGNLWATATPNDGDPIVLYDKAADRWFMAQFGTTGNKIYIAISQTPNPTGSWYTYTFTSPAFPDYLKFSVWQDGYYMTSNQAQKVFAFERTQMLLGNAASRAVYHTFSPPASGFFVPLPGDSGDGTLAPAGTPCPIFSYSDNGWGGSNVDAVNVFKCTTNWVPTTPTMTIASGGSVSCAAFDASYSSSWDDISQPGTTQKLDGIGGVCMFRAQWKPWNTAGYNSVVLNWGVKISTAQRSIRWCELREDQTTHVWSMYQQGTYTPDADTRWLGSIAMDDYGSIGLCYMKSNATSIYPGLYYTGRRICDPLGTLPLTEQVAHAGTASQTVNINRDGDYSETTLDPDGATFWHTGMYMGAGGAQKTQIYSFQITPCIITNPPVAAFTTVSTTVCSNRAVTFNDQSTNFPTSWSWSIPGAVPSTSTTQNPTFSFPSAGTYSVTLTATNGNGSNTLTQTNYITVNATPATPSVTCNTPICSGTANTITFSTATVAGATCSWTGPVSFTSSLQNPTRPATSLSFAGNYILTVTSGGCTSNPDTTVVVINATPSTPVITANTPVCLGSTLTMTIPAVTGATYSWSGPNSFASTTQNQSRPNATLAMAGTYSVTTTSPAGCVSAVGTKVVVVNAVPATPTITQSFAVLTASAASGYQWYLNGTLITGATSQTYTMTQNGSYTVVVTNAAGCASLASSALNVTNLGINELSEGNSLTLYPNPNDGQFTVSFNAPVKKNYKLKLVNALGQLVFEKSLTNVSGSVSQTIDISTYGKGEYMLILSDDKDQTVKQVLVH